MNLVDSSGWLEYFADGPNASRFAEAIEDVDSLLVSTINVYEVFKKVLVQRGEDAALQAVALLQQGTVIELSSSIALNAAKFSHDQGIPMADSIIYITARHHHATIWTQDADFEGLDNVRYFVYRTE